MFDEISRRKGWYPTRRAVGLGLSAMLVSPAMAQTASAAELMVASQEVSRFANVRFKAVLTIAGKSGPARVRELGGFSKVTEGEAATAKLMRVSAPPDMRGVGTLTIERKNAADDLWVYLPSLKRVRRLVASNRRDPWMGSDFSYGDIVGHEVADWAHTPVRRETWQSQSCSVIESTPLNKKTASETGYSKRMIWVRDGDAFAVRAEFFDLTGAVLKTMETSDVRLFDKVRGKSQAMRITMTAAKSKSTLVFGEFETGVTVTDADVAPGALTP